MRKYIKPELDIVKFDGVDVITMSDGSGGSESNPTVTLDPTETISPNPTGAQNPTENPLANPAEVHSSEPDNTAGTSGSTDDSTSTADTIASDGTSDEGDASGDVVPSGEGDASGDSASSEDAADTPVDEQPVEPAAEAEVVTGDMTTVE